MTSQFLVFVPGLLALAGLSTLTTGLFKSFRYGGDKRKSGFEHPLSILGAMLLIVAALSIMFFGGSIGVPH